jgi:hypothetical protein
LLLQQQQQQLQQQLQAQQQLHQIQQLQREQVAAAATSSALPTITPGLTPQGMAVYLNAAGALALGQPASQTPAASSSTSGTALQLHLAHSNHQQTPTSNPKTTKPTGD